MYLPSLQPVAGRDIYLIGDVEVDDQAILGPGVILQAAPGSKITIAPGACLGMGVIINVSQGEVEIRPGAILGAGVLVIGPAQIGENSCIGTASTIFCTSVPSQTIIPAGSLWGDNSRRIDTVAEDPELINPELDAEPSFEEEIKVSPQTAPSPPEPSSPVVGQVYINQLLMTLFPSTKGFKSNHNLQDS